jgi:hypothetical protein
MSLSFRPRDRVYTFFMNIGRGPGGGSKLLRTDSVAMIVSTEKTSGTHGRQPPD